MAEIRVNPEEIRAKGSQFKSKSEELQSLINSAKSMMAALESTFKGQRAAAIQNEWQSYQAGLANAVKTMAQTGDLLTRAANDFTSADSGM